MNSSGQQTGLKAKDSGGDPVGQTFEVDVGQDGELGKWRHGWQRWSSSIFDSYFSKGTMLSGRTAARRAQPSSARNAGAALAHCHCRWEGAKVATPSSMRVDTTVHHVRAADG